MKIMASSFAASKSDHKAKSSNSSATAPLTGPNRFGLRRPPAKKESTSIHEDAKSEEDNEPHMEETKYSERKVPVANVSTGGDNEPRVEETKYNEGKVPVASVSTGEDLKLQLKALQKETKAVVADQGVRTEKKFAEQGEKITKKISELVEKLAEKERAFVQQQFAEQGERTRAFEEEKFAELAGLVKKDGERTRAFEEEKFAELAGLVKKDGERTRAFEEEKFAELAGLVKKDGERTRAFVCVVIMVAILVAYNHEFLWGLIKSLYDGGLDWISLAWSKLIIFLIYITSRAATAAASLNSSHPLNTRAS
jgi:hypothetical protein